MFNWQEYYVLARKLLSQADSLPHDEAPQKEAMLRSAGSRAYYAAYHRACDYLRKAKRYPRHASNRVDSFVLVQGQHCQAESPTFDACLREERYFPS